MTRSATTAAKDTAVHSTRARSTAKKNNDKAADALMQVVEKEKEKKACEAKKKKRAEEKQAEEEKKKKPDAEKATITAPTVSRTSTVADIAAATEGMTIEQEDPLLTPTSETEEGDDESPKHHGINPNRLLYAAATEGNGTDQTNPSSTDENSPVKKKNQRDKLS